MANANDLNGLKMASTTTLKPSDISIHDFSVDTQARIGSSIDILDQFNDVVQQTQPESSQSTLTISAIDVSFDMMRVDFGDEGPECKLLREAKQSIEKQEFTAAMSKLEEVFEIVSDHVEAIYLQAYCWQRLNKTLSALETLRRLEGAELSNRLRTRVGLLRDEIRRKVLPTARRLCAKATNAKTKAAKIREAGESVPRLREFAELDPGMGKFHYYLAGALIVEENYSEAKQVIENGLACSETETNELRQLSSQLEQRYVPQALAPAKKLYRSRRHSEALDALDELEDDVQDAPLCVTFREHLGRLTKRGVGSFLTRVFSGGLTSSATTNSAPQMCELFEFLVAREMKLARAAFDANDHLKAEKELSKAVEICPDFALANYMLAASVYQRVAAKVKRLIGQIDDERARTLRRCRESLAEVSSYAEIGSRDPSNPDAKRLVNSIEQMRQQIEHVVQEHEDQAHDAQIVNDLIDEFIQTLVQIMTFNMAIAQGNAYAIRNQAEELYHELRVRRTTLSELRAECRGDQARSIIDLVRDRFVEPNFRVLQQAMGR